MGGYRGGGRDTTDQYNNINIKKFKERGYLKEGLSFSGTIEWSRNGDVQSSMGVGSYADNTALWFSFSGIDRSTQERRNYYHVISLAKTDCNYGGYRYWFVCPKCGKKYGKLYIAGNHFHCRKCLNLCYEDQKRGDLYKAFNRVYPKRAEAEELYKTIKYKYRNGKITRKYKKYNKLMRVDFDRLDIEELLCSDNKKLRSLLK
ncbi:MAG: hypothetical protein PHR61_01975 [Candidatus Absconditabacteria bacterium]|nr:hypothetical protein [Candidatus Absconditabacteria bacterium]